MALSDPRRTVRALASVELSELKAVTALPAMTDAAIREQQDLVQAEMFESALSLGFTPALQSLTAICVNPARRGDARLAAARALFGKGDHACFEAIAEMTLPSEDAADRIGAWNLLAQLRDRTKQETQAVLERSLRALSEGDPQIRMQASTTAFGCFTIHQQLNPCERRFLPRATSAFESKCGRTLSQSACTNQNDGSSATSVR